MKFLADENIPQSIIRQLREQGHQVKDIKKTPKSLTDAQVISLAHNAIVLTFDKDFLKEQVLRTGKVVVFDFPGEKSTIVSLYITSLVEQLQNLNLPTSYILIIRKDELIIKETNAA